MAGLLVGILKIVQQIFCAGSKDDEPQPHQQQQQQQGNYAQHANNTNYYPPQPQPTYPGAQAHGNNHNQPAWGEQQQHHQQQTPQHQPNYEQHHAPNRYEGKHSGGMIGSQPHGQYQASLYSFLSLDPITFLSAYSRSTSSRP
jgi:hypothetical protein